MRFKHLLLTLLYSLMMLTSSLHAYYEGEELGYIDEVRISDREFESLNKYKIEFYREDLVNGKITIEGILESELKHLPIEKINVEISVDGGDSWKKAKGHEDWSFSFAPESGKVYSLSLRVVKSSSKLRFEDGLKNAVDDALPSSITIAGFTLTPNSDASFVNGKLSGSGKISIPYLSNLVTGMNNTINVNFQDLSISNNIVTQNEISYTTPFTISTPLVDVDVTKLIFSPIPSKNKIEGLVTFKGVLASAPSISLPTTSKMLPSSFSLNLPFNGQRIDIWKKKNVQLLITKGSVDLGYTLGNTAPTVDLTIPTAKLKLGTLLTDANNVKDSIAIDLANIKSSININIDKDAYLLGTGIKIPKGLSLGLNFSNLEKPKISFSNSLDFSGTTNPVLTALSGANITATVTPDGFDATIIASGELLPVTILNRGGGNKDVKVRFTNTSPSFKITMNTTDVMPQIKLGDISAELHLGDILQSAKNSAQSTVSPIVAELDKVVKDGKTIAGSYSINIDSDAYLLGTGIKLPSGFNIGLDLSDINAPSLDFTTPVNLDEYDNIIAKNLTDANLTAHISTSSLAATITASKNIEPIVILNRGGKDKDVILIFKGDAPSFSIDVTGIDSLPVFGVSSITAELDFGDVLQTTTEEGTASVRAVVTTISSNVQDLVTEGEGALNSAIADAKSLKIILPDEVTLLNSSLKLLNSSTTFNMNTKAISLSSSLDLEDYKNPILDAFTGSTIDLDISSSGFSGKISLDDTPDDIVLLDRGADGKDVKLIFKGKPSLALSINNDTPSFSFNNLSADINFGDLLQTGKKQAQSEANSVVAKLSTALSVANAYTLSLENKVYLLGSNVALDSLDIGLNVNTKQLSLSGTADLKEYTSPLIKAFNGAHFDGTVLPTGFSASLSKKGGLDPITILSRGGKDKDVALVFSSLPTVSLRLKNGEVDFGFTGGVAQLHFGDLLENATADLIAFKDDKEKLISGKYSWDIEGKARKLFSASPALLSKLSGTLDLSNFTNPEIIFNANIDLKPYKGIFKNTTISKLAGASISKDGLSASVSVGLGEVNIWSDKNVRLAFTENPTISFSLTPDSFKFGFSDIKANLYFGTLLNDIYGNSQEVYATIGKLSDGINNMGNQLNSAKDSVVKDAKDTAAKALPYSWYINGKQQLADTEVFLENLGGSLDLSDVSNPMIILNGIASVPSTSALHKYISNAGVNEAKISANGFEGELVATLQDINIWEEKNVKLVFDEKNPPSLNIKLNGSGLKVGISNLDADLHLGTLLNDVDSLQSETIAELKTLKDNLYSWKIEGKQKVADTKLYLETLSGSLNLSDLGSPIINLNATADLSEYGKTFSKVKEISLTNSTISQEGFKGDISANIADITVWEEKKVNVHFEGTPTLHLELTANNFSVGVSDLSAEVNFGQLLEGEKVILSSLASSVNNNIENIESASQDLKKYDGLYTWSLDNSYKLIKKSETQYVSVSEIGGTVNLKDLTNPIIVFDANASFNNYETEYGDLGNVALRDATISRDGLKWNIIFEGASAKYIIYDYATGSNDDNVRVELANVSGHFSDTSAGITNADGVLYFGKLFQDKNTGNKLEPIQLHKASNGSISFETSQIINYKKDADNEVTLSGIKGKIIPSGDSYTVKFNGKVDVKAEVMSSLNIGKLGFSDFSINNSGFSGTVTATGAPLKSLDILNGNANIKVNTVGIHLKVAKTNSAISISQFDAKLGVGKLFNTANNIKNEADSLQADLSYLDKTYSWNVPVPVTLENFPKLKFTNLSGDLAFTDLSLTLSSDLTYTDYPGTKLSNTITVDDNGLDVDAKLTTKKTELLGVAGLSLNSLEVNVQNTAFESASISLQYEKDKFLGGKKLDIKLDATVTSDKAAKFSFDTDFKTLKIPKFADFKFTGIDVNIETDTFELALDGDIVPTNDLLKDFSNEISFTDLKINSSGNITLSAAEIWKDSGASAKIAGVDLQLKKYGFGFKNSKFFIGVDGEINFGDLGSGGALIKFYPDGTFDINKIEIAYNSNAASFAGMVEYKNTNNLEEFQGNFNLALLGEFAVFSKFTLGNVKASDSEKGFMYWKVEAAATAGNIPLAPLPISLYGFGGGLAYNMEYADGTWGASLGNIAVMAGAIVGTTADGGYSWHGDITLLVQTNGTVIMQGDSYFLSDRNIRDEDNKMTTRITFSTTPWLLHVEGMGTITQTAGKLNIIKVTADTDILFSSSDWHIYIGSKEQKIELVAIEFLKGSGYLQLDSGGIAVGVSYDFNLEGSCCAFYGQLYGGAGVDLLINARPLYVDAQGYIYIGLDAGVKAWGEKYSIFNAEARVSARFRAPSPTFIQLKAKMHYSIVGGLLSGTYRTTFWLPEEPDEDIDSLDDYPLISMLEPSNNEANVLPISALRLTTTVPIDTPLLLKEDYPPYEMLILELDSNCQAHGKYVDSESPQSMAKGICLKDEHGVRVPLSGGFVDKRELKLRPIAELNPGKRYTVKASARLILKVPGMTVKVPIKSVTNEFVVSTEPVPFAQKAKITPNRITKVIYPDTKIRINYINIYTGQTSSDWNNVELFDPLGEKIDMTQVHHIGTTNSDDSTRNYLQVFQPVKPLNPVYVYEKIHTGEIRKAIKTDDGFVNPFLYSEDTEETNSKGMIKKYDTNYKLQRNTVEEVEPLNIGDN